MPDGVPLCLSSAAAQSHVQVSSLSRGAQHWATGMSTEQRNHETAYIQLVEHRRPGASAKRAGSRNDFRRAGVFRGRTLQILQKASPLLRCRRHSISGRYCKTTSCMAFGAVTLPLRRQSWQPMCTAYMIGSHFFNAVGWLTIPHRNSCSSFDTTCCSTFVNA